MEVVIKTIELFIVIAGMGVGAYGLLDLCRTYKSEKLKKQK